MVDVAELSWTVTGEASGERTAVVLNSMTAAAAGAEAGLDKVGTKSRQTATDLAGISSSATSASSATRQTATEMAGLSGASTGATSSLWDMAQAVMAVDAAESAAAQGARELASATAGISPAMDRAAASSRVAAASYGDFYDAAQRDFSKQWVSQGAAVVGTNTKLGASNKMLQMTGLNLTRQLSDVFVMAASGQNPMVTLIQQGPQVADAFQTAGMAGIGFREVLRGLYAMLAPILAILSPIILAVGAFAGAFAIGAQQINAQNKGLIDSLGLTEAQLEKVKNKTVTMGDVMKGTWNSAAAALMAAFGPEIAAVQSAFDKWYAELIANTVKEVKAIVGFFVGGYEAIKATWAVLPAALGDATVSAANAVLAGVEQMINGGIAKINALTSYLNVFNALTNNPIRIPEIKPVEITRLKNQYSGTGTAIGEAFGTGFAKGAGVVDAAFAGIERETIKAWGERVRSEAGKAAKGHAEAADAAKKHADELEKLAKALAKLRDELAAVEARLGGEQLQHLRRFQEETDVLARSLMAGILPYERWVELNGALRAELDLLTRGVRAVDTSVSGLRAPMEGAKFDTKELAVTAAQAYDRFDQLAYSISGVMDAFAAGDWSGAMSGLLHAIDGITEAWKRSKTEAVAAVAAGVGQMIGGRAGSAISGAASGFMMGNMIMPGIGGIIGGALGGLAGLFGGGGEKKRAKAEEARRKAEEEAQKAAEIAQRRAELEIELLLAQGSAAEALAASRKLELAAMDASLHALQEQVWAAQDAKRIAEERAGVELEILRLTGREVEALAIERRRELEELDPTNRALQERVYALQDEAAALERLTEARGFAQGIADDLLKLLDPSSSEWALLRRAQAERAAEVAKLINVLPTDEFELLTEQVAALTRLEVDELMAKQAEAFAKAAAAFHEGMAKLFPAQATWQDISRAARNERLAAERAENVAAREAAEAQAAAWGEVVKAAEDGRQALLRSGNAAAAMAAEMSLYRGPNDGYSRAVAGADAARMLRDLASRDALNIENVGALLDHLDAYLRSPDLRRGIAAGLTEMVVASVGEANEAVRRATSDFIGSMADRSMFTRANTWVGPGLASVRSAEERWQNDSALGWAGGQMAMGRDVLAYREAIANLDRELASGAITADTRARAQAALDEIAGAGLVSIVDDFAAQQARATGSLEALRDAGLSSIAYYFGQITSAAAALREQAVSLATPLGAATSAIGRFKSMVEAFTRSANAARMGGADDASVAQAEAIAAAARRLADIVITEDAKRIQAILAKAEPFAGAGGTELRDIAFLLDGLKAFDAASLETVFTRVTDALIRGIITGPQFDYLIDLIDSIFRGEETPTEAAPPPAPTAVDDAMLDELRRIGDAVEDAAITNRDTASATGETARLTRETFEETI